MESHLDLAVISGILGPGIDQSIRRRTTELQNFKNLKNRRHISFIFLKINPYRYRRCDSCDNSLLTFFETKSWCKGIMLCS